MLGSTLTPICLALLSTSNLTADSPQFRGPSGEKPSETVSFQVWCYDLDSGEPRWNTTLAEQVPDYRLFILNEAGTTFVVAAGDTFELLHKSQIDDLFWATPAVAGDSLLLRGVDGLYCVREQ